MAGRLCAEELILKAAPLATGTFGLKLAGKVPSVVPQFSSVQLV
jgi:hypothetical protein